MDKQKVLVGIDPDTQASGWALYHRGRRELVTLQCYDLVTVFEELNQANGLYDLTVHLEAGWLEKKSNWSTRNPRGSKSVNERIAKNVGSNHEIGRQIEKFCAKYNISCKLIKPQGYSSWNHERFCAVTKWPERKSTNSEKRVAGLLVYGY